MYISRVFTMDKAECILFVATITLELVKRVTIEFLYILVYNSMLRCH